MPKKLIYNPENPKGILVDFTDAELSQKVIDDEKTVIRKTEFNAKRYQRDRVAEYPSIEELTVALWENVVEERTAAVISLETKRQAVKTKYPKA